jgi:hypothetical protein
MEDVEKTTSVRIEVPQELHEKMLRLKGFRTYTDDRKYTNNDIYLYAIQKVIEQEISD